MVHVYCVCALLDKLFSDCEKIMFVSKAGDLFAPVQLNFLLIEL